LPERVAFPATRAELPKVSGASFLDALSSAARILPRVLADSAPAWSRWLFSRLRDERGDRRLLVLWVWGGLAEKLARQLQEYLAVGAQRFLTGPPIRNEDQQVAAAACFQGLLAVALQLAASRSLT
jgi:hypothetical protein